MNHTALMKVFEAKKRTDIPNIQIGDTLRVQVRIREGEKERLQAFEGTLIAQQGSQLGETITIRKISFGHGVERIFPLHAPILDRIEIVRTGRVRRAKLYYLRDRRGKSARIAEVSNYKPKADAKA